MPWLENYPREYYSKYERVDVRNGQGWYEVYRLPHDVYAIAEPQQLQEVNAFLIIGGESALLLDTGMGILPIRPVVEELYQGPLKTVNSHCHFDHIGSNRDFAPIYAHDDDYVRKIAARGLSYEDVAPELTEECFQFGPPEGFRPEDYRVPPYQVIGIEDGYTFDLGGRALRVIATGGHCQDHICLFDETNHILFTGDFAYHGAMFANFDNELFGQSDFARYCDVIAGLSAGLPEDTKCYVSHNEFILSFQEFQQIAAAFQETARREAAGEAGDVQVASMGFDFGENGKAPHIYEFGKFSIYVKGD